MKLIDRIRLVTKPPGEFLYRFDVWLPLNDKYGVKVDRRKFIDLEADLYEKFRGLTRTPIVGNPVYEGFWEDDETLTPARDVSTLYTVLTPLDADSYQYFITNKRKWTKEFGQKKLLITVFQLEVL